MREWRERPEWHREIDARRGATFWGSVFPWREKVSARAYLSGGYDAPGSKRLAVVSLELWRMKAQLTIPWTKVP